MFVKELSFSQTTPTDDAFFNRTGLERVGVVRPDPGLLWIGLKALDRRAGDRSAAGLIYKLSVWLFSAEKNKKEEGPAGASPVATPMPKSVSL